MNASSKRFSVSINPTYKCSAGCKFCYLGDQRLDQTLLPLSKLHDKLSKLSEIETIDIYGGEISELTDNYIFDLLDCVRGFNPRRINITTNLSRISSAFLEPDVDLYVSWDYVARQDWKNTLSNLQHLHRDFSIITLATRKIAKELFLKEYVKILNRLEGLTSVEVKPYSPNQYNSIWGSEESFETVVKYLLCDDSRKFGLANEDLMNMALEGNRPHLHDHVFINPRGLYSTIDFDENGLEYFKTIKDVNGIFSKEVDDIVRMGSNPLCRECKYNQSCLSEHINYNTCTGHKDLLEWYETLEV